MDVAIRLLNGLLMLALPLALGVLLARRLGQRWGLFLAGAVTFVGSQALHIPFNLLLLNPRLELGQSELTANTVLSALLLGLSAGVFEELARYLVLRAWQRGARSWRAALMLGAGHGGVESMLLGLLVLLTLFQMIAYRGADLVALFSAEELPLAQQQIEAYWGAPAALSLLGALERLFALALHLSLSVMVMRSFTHANRAWLVAAIGWHALVDAAGVLSLPLLGAVATEGVIGALALISLWLVFRLRDRAEPDAEARPPERTGVSRVDRAVIGQEAIDRTRFSGS